MPMPTKRPRWEPRPIKVSPRALSIYKRMRKLERRCLCPDELVPGWSAMICDNCKLWWELNVKLNEALGTLSFPVYETPEAKRWYTPQPSAVARFYKLEAAASKAAHRRRAR
jgi:hypothetical protein